MPMILVLQGLLGIGDADVVYVCCLTFGEALLQQVLHDSTV